MRDVPHPNSHAHDDFHIPDDAGETYGVAGVIDMRPVGALIGATYDACDSCIEDTLNAVADLAARVHRVTELAYVVADRLGGGVPDDMVSDSTATTEYTPEFRAAMRAGAEMKKQALPTIAAMPHASRRNVARDAARVVVNALPQPSALERLCRAAETMTPEQRDRRLGQLRGELRRRRSDATPRCTGAN